MKQLGISIIGTDTDVGKTFVTGLLGAMAVDDGFAVGMVKPVSSSAVPFPECVTMDEDNYNIGLESKDATHLMRSAGIPESRRHEVNPYAIAGDFSPRLAAALAGIEMKDIKLPAIVVADGRLGSINRAVLTCEYAKLHGIEVKAIIVNDTTAVDLFLLKTNVADMERYTGVPVVAVVPPYQGPDIHKVQLGWARSFIDSKELWNTVLGL